MTPQERQAYYHADGLRFYADVLVASGRTRVPECPDQSKPLNEVQSHSAIARVFERLELNAEMEAV